MLFRSPMSSSNKRNVSRKSFRNARRPASQTSSQLRDTDVASYARPPLLPQTLHGPEIKVSDNTATASVLTSAGSVSKISTIAQGVSNVQRIADACEMKGLEFGLAVIPGTNVGPVRLIVFQYNLDDSAGAPTMASVLQNIGSLSVVSPYLLDGVDDREFSILHDELFNLASSTATVAKRIFVRANSRIGFNTGGATTGVGQIYALLTTTTASTGPIVTWNSRVYFTDV